MTTNMECAYQPAIVVQDLAGNMTTIAEQDMLVDRTPPSVTVSYDNGAYILTVSDNESGVWKITNRDGSVVYRDFSYSRESTTT